MGTRDTDKEDMDDLWRKGHSTLGCGSPSDYYSDSTRGIRNMRVNITIPKNWFVYGLIHNHSACNYRDVLHSPGNWSAELQHIIGGCLVKATGVTPQDALYNAIEEIKRCKEERIWYGKVVQGISVYDEEEKND